VGTALRFAAGVGSRGRGCRFGAILPAFRPAANRRKEYRPAFFHPFTPFRARQSLKNCMVRFIFSVARCGSD
jgi:hypothetical protein